MVSNISSNYIVLIIIDIFKEFKFLANIFNINNFYSIIFT